MSPVGAKIFRQGGVLGAHQLLEPLAEGGMGSVWAAKTLGPQGFEKLVAIKTLLAELTEEEEYAKALGDEARLAARLCHPNLCEVLDLGVSEGYPFLVMEWVEGGALSDVLKSDTTPSEDSWLPIEATVSLLCQAAAGLHALHEARDDHGSPLAAVHRDVSPQNLLLSVDGTLKVVDFGIAKARGQRRARTRSGQLRGKLGYLAPEQIRGQPVTRRTDIHALGCVAYQCVTGQLPFAPSIDAFEDVLHGRFPPPSESRSELPPLLGDFIQRALSPDPERRPASMLELRKTWEEWLCERGARPRVEVARLLQQRLPKSIARRNARIRAELSSLSALHGS